MYEFLTSPSHLSEYNFFSATCLPFWVNANQDTSILSQAGHQIWNSFLFLDRSKKIKIKSKSMNVKRKNEEWTEKNMINGMIILVFSSFLMSKKFKFWIDSREEKLKRKFFKIDTSLIGKTQNNTYSDNRHK